MSKRSSQKHGDIQQQDIQYKITLMGNILMR